MRLARAVVRCEGQAAIVEVEGERGEAGLGEASPLEGRSRDSLEHSIEVLSAAAASLSAIDEAADPKSAVAAALAGQATALVSAPSARFALETALFDLLGKIRGASIAELLGGARPYHDVGVNALVYLTRESHAAELIARCDRLVGQGFVAIKLKLPKEADDAVFEAARQVVASLRAARPELELRLDVNGAWNVEVAPARLAALEGLALRYVEQPVAPKDVMGLAGSRVPWAADESLEEIDVDPAALLAIGRCAAFVLKPTCIGGLLRARALGETALARGADVVVTHAFEGAIARAAARQLALSFSRPPLACGLAPATRSAHG